MSKHNHATHHLMGERICELAARLMDEDGVQDYALAKRKAARQLGAEDTRHLPDNAEIEAALRQRFALYHPEETRNRLHKLRTGAAAAMQRLSQFAPRLIGPVLNGSATRFAAVELLVFCDDLNELLFFLMHAQQAYKLSARRFKVGAAVRELPLVRATEGDTDLELIVAPRMAPGMRLRSAEGRELESVNLHRLQSLLSNSTAL